MSQANLQNSLFGQTVQSFGPCNIYFDTASGGSNTALGGFDSATVSMKVGKIPLKECQSGDQPADMAVSSQIYTVALGMSRATVDRLEKTVQGFTVDRDTAGNPQRLFLASVIGMRDSSIVKQLTIKEIIDGIEADSTTQPFHIWHFPLVAPMSDSTDLVYDASSQRYFKTVFQTYIDRTILDQNGRPVYGYSEANV